MLTAIFPGGPGLTDTSMSPFGILLELRNLQERFCEMMPQTKKLRVY